MGSNRNSVPFNDSEHSSSRDINMSLMEKNKETKRKSSSQDKTNNSNSDNFQNISDIGAARRR